MAESCTTDHIFEPDDIVWILPYDVKGVVNDLALYKTVIVHVLWEDCKGYCHDQWFRPSHLMFVNRHRTI